MEPFTCPVCARTSYNPHDAEYGWCGNCQGYTTEDPPEGTRWVLFRAKDGSLRGRLLDAGEITVGDLYEMIADGSVYLYDGEAFVEA